MKYTFTNSEGKNLVFDGSATLLDLLGAGVTDIMIKPIEEQPLTDPLVFIHNHEHYKV